MKKIIFLILFLLSCTAVNSQDLYPDGTKMRVGDGYLKDTLNGSFNFRYGKSLYLQGGSLYIDGSSLTTTLSGYALLNGTNNYLQGNTFYDSFYVYTPLRNVARTDTINSGNMNITGTYQINGVPLSFSIDTTYFAHKQDTNTFLKKQTFSDIATFNDTVIANQKSFFNDIITINDTLYTTSKVRFGTIPATIVGNAPYYFDDDIAIGLNSINYPILEFDRSAYTLYIRNTAGNYGLELTGGTNPVMSSYATGFLSIQHKNTFYNRITIYPNSTSNTEVAQINAAGEFLIGTTDNGAYPFQVNGASYFVGNLSLSTGRLLPATGSNVASATTTTLGNGNKFLITGTTTIDNITTTNWTAGAIVTLEFADALTLRSDRTGAGQLLLEGITDFVTSTGDVLVLVFDGVDWVELARMDR